MKKHILLRVTTVPQSLWKLLEGQMKYMSSNFDVHAVSSPGDKLSIVKEKEGVETHEVRMYRGISPLKDLIAILEMIRLIKKVEPTIIHSHTPKAGLISMIAGFISRTPIRLHTIAGIPAESENGIKRWLLLKMEQLTYLFSTKIYPNSYSLKKFVLDNNLIKKEKLKVIGNGSSNGIDLEHFNKSEDQIQAGVQKRKDLFIKQNDFIYLFIGRLVKDKGIVELIEAFQRVIVENTNVKLLLLGSFEPLRDALPDITIKKINENKNILHLGYIQDIRPYLCMSDSFVFPTHREGLPNVLLQASAYSLPIVASNVTGNSDIIKEKENGILFEKGSIEELSNGMSFVKNNKKESIRLGQTAYKTVIENYEQKYLWKSIEKEYSKFIKNI